jgi:hypothetical protein
LKLMSANGSIWDSFLHRRREPFAVAGQTTGIRPCRT